MLNSLHFLGVVSFLHSHQNGWVCLFLHISADCVVKMWIFAKLIGEKLYLNIVLINWGIFSSIKCRDFQYSIPWVLANVSRCANHTPISIWNVAHTLQSSFVLSSSRAPLPKENSDFYLYVLLLQVCKLHVNGNIQYALFCVFGSNKYFWEYPCCCVCICVCLCLFLLQRNIPLHKYISAIYYPVSRYLSFFKSFAIIKKAVMSI